MILRSEEDEEIDIVAEPEEGQRAPKQFVTFQQHQHNSKVSRADCMKRLQTCELPIPKTKLYIFKQIKKLFCLQPLRRTAWPAW